MPEPYPNSRDPASDAAAAVTTVIVDALRAWLRGEPVTLANVQADVASIIREALAEHEADVRREYTD